MVSGLSKLNLTRLNFIPWDLTILGKAQWTTKCKTGFLGPDSGGRGETEAVRHRMNYPRIASHSHCPSIAILAILLSTSQKTQVYHVGNKGKLPLSMKSFMDSQRNGKYLRGDLRNHSNCVWNIKMQLLTWNLGSRWKREKIMSAAVSPQRKHR